MRQCCQSWLILLAVLAALRVPVWADGPGKEPPGAMLYLADGDFFTGALEDSEVPDVISWQSTGAVRPFQFPLAAIRAAYFPPLLQRAAAEADYCFELSDGDLLFGSLVSLSPDKLEIDSPRFGRLHVERSQVRRLLPWHSSTAWEYSGPNGLSEWEHQPEEDGWQEEAGHLLTSKPGASLRKRVNIPKRARFEFAISWNGKPNFVFGISAGDDPKLEREGYHFEVWNGNLVVVGELWGDADVATVYDLKTAKNRLHLQALLDQQKGVLSIHSLDGSKLAEIAVQARPDRPLDWISLRNQRGDVRLEQLVVSHWNGQLPPQIDVDRERIQLADGKIVYGDIERYEADTRRFVIHDGTEEKEIDAGQAASIVLRPPGQPAESSVRIGCHDGTRIGGLLSKVDSGNLHVARAGVEEALIFPVADVRFLIGARGQNQRQPGQKSVGRLELEGVRSHGALIDGKSDGTTNCLVWQPNESTTASALQPNVSGRIVYRDPPPPAPVQQPQPQVQRQRGFLDVIAQAFSGPQPELASRPRISGYPHTLFLLAGDRIPCIVDRIDDEGVHFTSSVIESEMIPHEQLKAVELAPRSAASALAEEKRLRLLTLPRMQKNNPPTHLIASTGGDFLRARLQSMDGQSLAAETRLETKRLPRGHVASIIWLHPVDDGKQPAANLSHTTSSAHVQAVRADGVRLTFVPREFRDNSLVGASELLGACQVEMKIVDQLLFGERIGDAADEPIYDAWKLQDAVEPKFAQDDAEGSPSSTGLNSPLVAKPAPDFRLELLDGGHFRMSDEKKHVVVLDFWASWCADCMRGMPEVIQVVQEFADKDVKYVAVNLQEDRTTITSALERMKLQPTVALDIDGATAEKYEVTAIPQIVIVDGAGNVARLFIGADLNFADHLRQALQELVTQNGQPEKEANGP